MANPSFDLDDSEWSDPDVVARRLAEGADPNLPTASGDPVLATVVRHGRLDTLALLLPRIADVDALGGGFFDEGRTALWTAVFEGRLDMARALVVAGADPWRDMMSGWSPGRLAMAGREPDLFAATPAGAELTDEEAHLVELGRGRGLAGVRVHPGLPGRVENPEFGSDGWSLAAVSGITAAEAIRRLGGTKRPAPPQSSDPFDCSYTGDLERCGLGAVDVKGGCLLTHPFSFAAHTPRLLCLLSAEGGSAYGVYANPASGAQGTFARDAVLLQWDASPGAGLPEEGDDARLILIEYLARAAEPNAEVAHACLQVGIPLPDAHRVAGPADVYFDLPDDGTDWFGDDVRWPD